MKPNKFTRAVKRTALVLGTRPLLRDAVKILGLPFHRVIFKTPRVGGRRLAIKGRGDLETERKRRNALEELHLEIRPSTYNFFLSKRYPSVRGKRVERYYDRPSLEDFVELRKNRRMKIFLAENHVTMEKAHAMAMEVLEEFTKNCSALEISLDFGADQFLADSIDRKGKLNIILVDI